MAGYRSSHADLVKIFALDPGKANGFFASIKRASAEEDEEEVELEDGSEANGDGGANGVDPGGGVVSGAAISTSGLVDTTSGARDQPEVLNGE